MESNLLISFPDQSKSFAYGVEYGRLLEKMERHDLTIENNKFPVRLENKAVIEETCRRLGYTPIFGNTYFDEWIEFIAVRKLSTDN